MPALRLLVADDHEIVRKGLRAIVESAHECEVVGEATDGRQAVTMAKELNPDIVVLDAKRHMMNRSGTGQAVARAGLAENIDQRSRTGAWSLVAKPSAALANLLPTHL